MSDPSGGDEPPGPRDDDRPGDAVYTARFLDHCNHPRNVGSFPADDPLVAAGRAEASECRDVLVLQLLLDASRTHVRDARFRAFGCSGTIAMGSLATERLRGLSIASVRALDGAALGRELSLPEDKAHCAALVEDAVRAAIRHWEATGGP